MKLLVMSDLHFEFHRDGGEAFCERYRDFGDYDVAVIAGDLCDFKSLVSSVCLLSGTFKRVVWVLGNHEHYGASVRDTHSVARGEAERYPNVHLLENDTVTIDGQRFVGTTLWFPPKDDDDWRYRRGMSDFWTIQLFDPHDMNREAVSFLWQTVTEADVVVTHHLPSHMLVHPKYEKSVLNRFFVADQETLIAERQPKVWINGHTHESASERIGKTRLLVNPYGYQGHEVNPRFQERLVIDV
jgi:Icc-related predicted phosphoesterase